MSGYDPAGPLPHGTVLLEASAGTGKTHAIAALATRYLAEGEVSADRLAVISFSRIASAELRSRVRQRLGQTRTLLQQAAGGGPLPESLDATDRLLTTGSRPELLARHGRLVRAMAGLDAATIMTIHEFCQAMLGELGILADQDPQAVLAEDLGMLLDQVVDDLVAGRCRGASARGLAPPDAGPVDLADRVGAAVLCPVVLDGRTARHPAAVVVDEHEPAGGDLRLQCDERVHRRLVQVAVEAQH